MGAGVRGACFAAGGCERHAVDDDRARRRSDPAARPGGHRPTAGRAARTSRAPTPPARRAVARHPAARIAEQPVVFRRLHVDVRAVSRISIIRAARLRARASVGIPASTTGLNWQPSTKKSKNPGCVSSRQCSTVLTSASSSWRLVRESSAIVAPSIAALPTCTILSSGRLGISPIRFDASMFRCRPKPPAR